MLLPYVDVMNCQVGALHSHCSADPGNKQPRADRHDQVQKPGLLGYGPLGGSQNILCLLYRVTRNTAATLPPPPPAETRRRAWGRGSQKCHRNVSEMLPVKDRPLTSQDFWASAKKCSLRLILSKGEKPQGPLGTGDHSVTMGRWAGHCSWTPAHSAGTEWWGEMISVSLTVETLAVDFL